MRRRLTEIYQIDGQPMLAPDGEAELSFEDLDSPDSGRDESGVMHRSRLREGVVKATFSYTVLTPEDYAYLNGLFCGKSEFQFTFPYPDGGSRTVTAYRSKASIVLRNHVTGEWRNYKFNIIEC